MEQRGVIEYGLTRGDENENKDNYSSDIFVITLILSTSSVTVCE